jgi:hypothetical protein
VAQFSVPTLHEKYILSSQKEEGNKVIIDFNAMESRLGYWGTWRTISRNYVNKLWQEVKTTFKIINPPINHMYSLHCNIFYLLITQQYYGDTHTHTDTHTNKWGG